MKPIVLIDTREKKPWRFENSEYFGGFQLYKLDYGDYSLSCFFQHNFLWLERKKSFYELLSNIFGKSDRHRFLKRLDETKSFVHRHIIVEANASDIYYQKVKNLNVKPDALLSRITAISFDYDVKFWLAGVRGKEICLSILKKSLKEWKKRSK
jgi:ERCC4-type nuclease